MTGREIRAWFGIPCATLHRLLNPAKLTLGRLAEIWRQSDEGWSASVSGQDLASSPCGRCGSPHSLK